MYLHNIILISDTVKGWTPSLLSSLTMVLLANKHFLFSKKSLKLYFPAITITVWTASWFIWGYSIKCCISLTQIAMLDWNRYQGNSKTVILQWFLLYYNGSSAFSAMIMSMFKLQEWFGICSCWREYRFYFELAWLSSHF